MKKTLLFVIVLMAILCTACDGEQEMVTLVGRKSPWGEGMTDTVNVYNNNGANIGSFPVGTKCRVLSKSQTPDLLPIGLFDVKWLKVECGGIAGYIVDR